MRELIFAVFADLGPKRKIKFPRKISKLRTAKISSLKGSVHSEFLIFVMIKCVFLTDVRSKTMTCYTFSVRPTIPESRNVKVAMKKFDEEENDDFCEEECFNFEELSFGEEKE